MGGGGGEGAGERFFSPFREKKAMALSRFSSKNSKNSTTKNRLAQEHRGALRRRKRHVSPLSRRDNDLLLGAARPREEPKRRAAGKTRRAVGRGGFEDRRRRARGRVRVGLYGPQSFGTFPSPRFVDGADSVEAAARGGREESERERKREGGSGAGGEDQAAALRLPRLPRPSSGGPSFPFLLLAFPFLSGQDSLRRRPLVRDGRGCGPRAPPGLLLGDRQEAAHG